MAKTCAICGTPSGMYPLCTSCFKLRDEGRVIKCDDCGTWHLTDKPCQCEPEPIKKEAVPAPIEDEDQSDELLCLTCGEPSNGKHFCKKCYYKYRNKSLLLRTTECKEFQILDESYEGMFVCKDGHIVKSKSELYLDDYFYDNKIPHVYEKTVYDENTKIHPDFYLKDQDVYWEHWGFNDENQKYSERKQFKLEIYRKLGYTVICTDEADTKEFSINIEHKLNTFEKGKINFLKD